MAYLGGLLGNLSGASGFGDQLRQNFRGENPLFNLSMGLLSQLGPSLTPTSPFQRLGRAGVYASEANQQALQNQLMREKMSESKTQKEKEAAFVEGVKSGAIPLPPGVDPATFSALFGVSPEGAVKYGFPAAQTPQDQLEMLNLKAKLLELDQKLGEGRSEAVTEPVAALGNVTSIAEASQRLDKAGSIFQPGGIINKFGGTDLAAAGLTGLKASGQTEIFGANIDDALVNVADAQTVEKATSALANSLQGVASSSTRSAYALRNIQTALAANTIWPTKRRALVENLKVVFADVEAKGIQDKIPGYEDAKKLYDSLVQQDVEFTKGSQGGAGNPAPPIAPAEADRAAASASLNAPQSVGYGVQNGQLVAQPAPAYTDLPPQPPTPEQPFNPNSNYVMEGPGVGSFTADLFGQSMPQMQNYAAPYIQQGSKAAAQAAEAVAPIARQAVQGARKVGTVAYDALGRAVFRSKQEFDRMVKNGSLVIPPEGLKAVIGGKSGTLYPE